MVSTRAVKLKFVDGERVLCYEPDPTKAKVLYDSKVLEVIANKDNRGRKSIEYLIHFQGWNSSWDRCVSEDFVLKDTPENRQLQKDLAEKAQLQLGAYLYRRERKKRKERKLSDKANHPSSEDGSCGSPVHMDTDDTTHTGLTTSSESASSGDEDIIPLELTATLKHALEQDNFLIKTKHKLLKLPAEPNVIAILDKYWKHYMSHEVAKVSDKPNVRNRNSINSLKSKPEHVQHNLNTCKELIDGLRIYFDYTLNDILLYDPERGQTITSQALSPPMCTIKIENNIKTEIDDGEYSHLPPFDNSDDNRKLCTTGKRWLRSHRSTDSELNGNQVEVVESPPNGAAKLFSWQILPDHVYLQDPAPPCLVYGATHLARLLVKLPDLLYASNISDQRLKLLLVHLERFIGFLSDHNEWFGDKYYIDAMH